MPSKRHLVPLWGFELNRVGTIKTSGVSQGCLQASRVNKYPIRFQSRLACQQLAIVYSKSEGKKKRETRGGGWSITKTNDEGEGGSVERSRCEKGRREKKGGSGATKRRIGRQHTTIASRNFPDNHVQGVDKRERERTGSSACKTGTNVETNVSTKPTLRVGQPRELPIHHDQWHVAAKKALPSRRLRIYGGLLHSLRAPLSAPATLL